MTVKRLLFATAAALSLSLASGCAENIYSSPKPGIAAGPALWQVSDADTTIYLFGTVHALPKDKQWFDARIERAWDASDEFVTEIDVTQVGASGQALAAAATLPAGQNLRQLMTPENRQQFEEAMVALGLPVEAFDTVDPWYASITMSLLPLLRTGYSPDSGVEQNLGGKVGTKKRDALETVQDQVNLFDKMPLDAQLAFLDQTVEALPEASVSLDQMVGEWAEGDAAELAKLMNSELSNPILRDRLLIQRNANWAVWLDNRLKAPGTVFVAVGAGHLAGSGSVQDKLRKRGIKVRRIWQ